MPYIIGEERYQSTLYQQTLEELIDANNLVRTVDVFIEAVDLHAYMFLNTVLHLSRQAVLSSQDTCRAVPLWIYQ